jgi:hypothetical protein
MAGYKVAVLKCTWSDTPFTGTTPQGLAYDDWVLNRMFLPLQPWWGVASFWQHCSYGMINLEGSQIFPWRRLTGFPTPVGMAYLRGAVAQQAVTQAKKEGWPLDDFQHLVIWVAPSVTNPQDAGSSPETIDGKPFCTLYEGSRHDFYTHEFGHALGFVHPWGPSGTPGAGVLPYQDPYCVMSAMTYAGAQPVFAIPPDPDGPPAGEPFWGSLPPMPSAATMYATVPDFADSAHVQTLSRMTVGWRRSLRLRARDRTNGEGPVVAVVPCDPDVSGPRQAYTVELRRPQDWDRGIERRDAAQAIVSPLAGVVVHTMQALDEYQGQSYELEKPSTPCFEGVVVLPLMGSDNDWVAPAGDFVVRVDNAAADLSWVDVTLGSVSLDRDGAVSLLLASGTDRRRVEEGVAEGVPIFVCGRGDFQFWVDHQSTTVICAPTPSGYEQPAFSWRLNGVVVPPQPGTQTVEVPCVSTFPGPVSTTKQARIVPVTVDRDGSNLVVNVNAADGNFRLDVEVTVLESDPNAGTSPSAATSSHAVEGILVIWEDAYYEAFDRCVKRVRDINDRFSESKTWPALHPGDPVSRYQLVIDLMRQESASARPHLVEQLDLAQDVFASRRASF